jgi:asparagine synthase (glutamine-hydrolysing)
LISKEFRDALHEPLRTVSLIREDRENCPDWRCINEILKADPWLQPYILSSSRADEVWQSVITGMAQADEPFMHAYGFTYGLTYAAARARGCGVVLDGMAGDTLFYGFNHSANVMGHNRLYRQVPAMLAAWQRHGLQGGNRAALRALLPFEWAPDAVRALARRRRDARALRSGNLQWLKPEVARGYLARNSSSAYWAGERMAPASDQMAHARYFTEGLNASAHETYGSMAKSLGVEPRSPFSDRRMIEFAVRMPLEAKFAWPWYKHVLRNGTAGLLPDAVRWRTEVGMHPGWTFYARLARNVFSGASPAWRGATAQDILSPWVRPEAFPTRAALEGSSGDEDGGQRVLFLTLLAHWVESHGLKD